MPSAASPDGADAIYFKQKTRELINRKLDALSTEQLLSVLGHLILQERKGPDGHGRTTF